MKHDFKICTQAGQNWLSKARFRPTCNPNNNRKHMTTYALAPDSSSSAWCNELKHGCASLTLHSANRCRCIFTLSRYIKWVYNKMCCTQSYPHNTPAFTVCGVRLLSLPQTEAAPAAAHRLSSNTIPQQERTHIFSWRQCYRTTYAQTTECDMVSVQTDIAAYRRHRESVSSALNLQRMKVMFEKRSLSSGPQHPPPKIIETCLEASSAEQVQGVPQSPSALRHIFSFDPLMSFPVWAPHTLSRFITTNWEHFFHLAWPRRSIGSSERLLQRSS